MGVKFYFLMCSHSFLNWRKHGVSIWFPIQPDRTLSSIRVTNPSCTTDNLAIVETESYSCRSELRFSPADYPISNLFTIGFGN